jgi:hypothetical protein
MTTDIYCQNSRLDWRMTWKNSIVIRYVTRAIHQGISRTDYESSKRGQECALHDIHLGIGLCFFRRKERIMGKQLLDLSMSMALLSGQLQTTHSIFYLFPSVQNFDFDQRNQ